MGASEVMERRAATPDRGTSRADLTLADGGEMILSLSGDWILRRGLPQAGDLIQQLDGQQTGLIAIDSSGLGRWDDALVNYVIQLKEACDRKGLKLDTAALPEGARRLVDLALAVPERAGARRVAQTTPFLEAVGRSVQAGLKDAREMITFIGEATLMFGRFFVGKAIYRRRDLWLNVQQCGADALPIVTVISLLVGLILAFVGAVQLEQFGASIYVADLVAIAMLREMGALMTGIVLAGRTGAAFAAQIGTMQGNEEIDALQTLGVPAMDFLVLPRMLALMLMMPLLTVYSDVIGILGGWVIGAGMLGLDTIAYFNETRANVGLIDFFLGVFKGAVFGIIIAVAGCLKGLQCGRSAASVGIATTSAVVTGIVFIIAVDGLFAVITNVLGI